MTKQKFNIRSFLSKYISLRNSDDNELRDVLIKLKDIENDAKNFKKDMAKETAELIKLKDSDIRKLKLEAKSKQKELTSLKGEDFEKANFWNNKWKQSPVKYPGRNNHLYDVRSFIAFPSIVLEDFCRTDIKIYPKDSNDIKVSKIIKWAIDNLTYHPDDGEYWMYAEDMLYKKRGDCEDGNHLIVSLMLNAGIPDWRAKASCGDAYELATMQKFGHSYPIYLREKDDEWVSLDWSVYPSKAPVSERPKAKELKYYGRIWWTNNHIRVWAQHEIELTQKKMRDEEVRE